MKNCCFCLTLRVGSIIFAIVNMVFYSIFMLIFVLAWVMLSKVQEEHEKKSQEMGQDSFNVRINTNNIDGDPNEEDVNVPQALLFLKGVLFVPIIFCLIWITNQIFLLVGICKKTACLVTTWIVIHSILLCLEGLFLVISLAGGDGFAIPLVTVVKFGMEVYFLVVVVFYRREMMQGPSQLPSTVVAYNPGQGPQLYATTQPGPYNQYSPVPAKDGAPQPYGPGYGQYSDNNPPKYPGAV